MKKITVTCEDGQEASCEGFCTLEEAIERIRYLVADNNARIDITVRGTQGKNEEAGN